MHLQTTVQGSNNPSLFTAALVSFPILPKSDPVIHAFYWSPAFASINEAVTLLHSRFQENAWPGIIHTYRSPNLQSVWVFLTSVFFITHSYPKIHNTFRLLS